MQSNPQPAGVAVVGSINADLTAFGTPLPRPGETVQAESFTMMLGGKGANQALAASRAGAATFMVGAVGEDVFRSLTLDALAADGVNTDAVAVLEGHTGIAHIRVDVQTGQNDIAIVAEANGRVTPEIAAQQLRRLTGRIGVVLLQLEIPVETVVRAAEVAGELGCLVILDPAPARPLPEEIWGHVDVVVPNETEAEVMTGVRTFDTDSAVRAGQWFLDRGVETAIITLAERGAVVVQASGARSHPAFRIEPVDTTAAGDAFAGALGAALARQAPWEVALRRALAGGAIAATVRGASPSLPTAEQVDAFLADQTS